jgi:hypothetical protein
MCPGSAALNYGVDNWSEFTDEGTAAHYMLEWCLKQGKDAEAFPWSSIWVNTKGYAWCVVDDLSDPADGDVRNEFEADEDMREYIQVVLDDIWRHAKGNDVQAEQRITLSDTLGVPDQGGTADAIVLDDAESTIQVHDLKYGRSPRGIVWAGTAENPNNQLGLYGLGALEELDLLHDWQTVELHVHQPRLNHKDSVPVPVPTLRALAQSARAAAAEAMSGFDTDIVDHPDGREEQVLVPKSAGELYELGLLRATDAKGCTYCAHAADCRALREAGKQAALSGFDDVQDDVSEKLGYDVPEAAVIEAFDADPPSPAQLSLIETMVDAVRNSIYKKLKRGEPVRGWKLVKGRPGPRKWIATALGAVEELLKTKFRLKTDEMYSKKLKSPTQMEKVLKESPKRWEQVTEYVTRSDGSETLAPADDPRTAIEHASALDGFDDITGDDGSDLT